MQAEAGQPLDFIVARKELERRAGDGLFFWGVGNPPNRNAHALARLKQEVDVVFSVMKTPPKGVDANPSGVLLWRKFLDAEGVQRDLPPNALITSRSETSTGKKRVHYALMCHSDSPLVLGDFGAFDPTAYKNFGDKGAQIGSSQVTALVQLEGQGFGRSEYKINLRAKLTEAYWVRLLDPVEIAATGRNQLGESFPSETVRSSADWCKFVSELKKEARATNPDDRAQSVLL
jgi:hypothetical protein